ncbi:unnamed protein product [Durusdinium trenchii]|uniref:Uncharacterized protein n=1 Tax=Durusdinium trenchii TaxID=1381693 RepID=A0ABP0RXK0_9DINO
MDPLDPESNQDWNVRDLVGRAGKLELLYSSALRTNKAMVEEEALQALADGDSSDSGAESLPELPLRELSERIQRRSLHEKRMDTIRAGDQSYKEMLDSGKLKVDSIDFFSQVNPDCFNVNGRPCKPQVRFRPPRPGDARRRPHVPLDQDFDSPSEDEEEPQAQGSPPRDRRKKRYEERHEENQRGAAPETQMGQVEIQERPQQAKDLLALPDVPSGWPCGPHCCIEHCRNFAKALSDCSLRELATSFWSSSKVVPVTKTRGVFKADGEELAVAELREVRECQVAMKAYKPSTRALQRAS